jgi:formylglycine-generating enzyme required for sulfatase activity
MHGNVFEKCLDRYGPYPKGPVTDPEGPGSGKSHVLRGGSWYFPPKFCRAAERLQFTIVYRIRSIGFRVVLTRAALKKQ